jgi:hypothetical protein
VFGNLMLPDSSTKKEARLKQLLRTGGISERSSVQLLGKKWMNWFRSLFNRTILESCVDDAENGWLYTYASMRSPLTFP